PKRNVLAGRIALGYCLYEILWVYRGLYYAFGFNDSFYVAGYAWLVFLLWQVPWVFVAWQILRKEGQAQFNTDPDFRLVPITPLLRFTQRYRKKLIIAGACSFVVLICSFLLYRNYRYQQVAQAVAQLENYRDASQIRPDTALELAMDLHSALEHGSSSSAQLIQDHLGSINLQSTRGNDLIVAAHLRASLGYYYEAVEEDLQRANAEFKAAVFLYPDLHYSYYYSLAGTDVGAELLDSLNSYEQSNLAAEEGLDATAASHLYDAIREDPTFAWAHNNLAWLRVTCEDPDQRNYEEALEHALKATELSEERSWSILDTLAAAYSVNGHYSLAVETLKKSLSLTPESQMVEAMRLIKLYESGMPWNPRSEPEPLDALEILELDSKDPEALATVLGRGNYAAVLDFDPDNTDALAMKEAAPAVEKAVSDGDYAAAIKINALLARAELLKLPPITNSIDMSLKLLPPGEFVMGIGGEQVSEVELTNIVYMGVHEVTQEQYELVVGGNPSALQTAQSPLKPGQNPVESVSWEDATAFCRELSALPAERSAGRIYRLPTEAEWEYACRAGTSSNYTFGDSYFGLAQYAWYNANSSNRSHPVGSKKPNAWGLYDMHGNVDEWCQDWLGPIILLGANPTGPTSGSDRVIRGGSWSIDAENCTSAVRFWDKPTATFPYVGFRVVCFPAIVDKP
ncbi:SUMF1/EgtB/PvdO family nonheme iron enzyme, partial [bacterium]|nr:SUMF1/EgtB/PvdO family nonheme iron enzyme [bacterium]